MSNIVVVEEAVKHYQRGVEEVRAIDGVNLQISQGDFLAVVGRSGSGKTTLLNLIGCVDRPTGGRVTVHGMETGDLSERALATIRSTTIGFVFQHFFLIPTLTATENVMVPGRFCAKRNDDLVHGLINTVTHRERRCAAPARRATEAYSVSTSQGAERSGRGCSGARMPSYLWGSALESRAKKLLDLVGLADRADHLPHELSGGEMQRVALARALINEPAILLADEPTGNLDTRSAEEIADIFGELNEGGLTIVVVTHSTELTGNATRVVHLLDGKIVEEELVRPAPVLEREPESQSEPVAVPEYMPSSLVSRRWGSPVLAVPMVLLGAFLFATAFMPWIGKFNGYRLMDQGFFVVRFYSDNNLTRIYTTKPAVILTGVWPIALGVLLFAAGILFLFNLQRIGRWSAMAIGLCGTAVAANDILMINNRLGPGIPVEYGLWFLLVVGIAALAFGVLLIYTKRYRPVARDQES